ncbi:DUF554 domain-containing protein [Romeria aff. gracilis LEGE 07310]|uniref:DUF554 domain-containing protein n=1 Tax=Vasconcelosia minhoensis LEGE 07310 TaxID=915328 RepID=A0A8J7AH27_9CYAN|nr:DUF554 domain-containing protein [Romeria gracilis]MBE9078809.1 DUF554 domain-containing protein [Romeria aff. gracilis LEGE 07310]
MLSLWAKTSGTWINIATVLLGTGCGLLLRDRLPLRMQVIITQAVGLFTLFIGSAMGQQLLTVQAGSIDGVILGLLALVFGGLLGEWWQLEQRLVTVGDRLKKQFRGSGRFTEGFVAATLLFCVGPMTLLGSLSNGLSGDANLLVIKATMDGLVSIALAGSYGVGIGFAILPILIYQGGLSLLAGSLAAAIPNPAQDPRIALVTGIGGIMILGLGLNLIEIAQVRVASFLPALLLAPVIYGLAVHLAEHF